MSETQQCTVCNKNLTLDNFSKDSSKRLGIRRYCKDCQNTQAKERHKNNKEEINKRKREKYDTDIEVSRQKRRDYRKTEKGKAAMLKTSKNQYLKIKNDPELKRQKAIVGAVWRSINSQGGKKSARTHELLGISIPDFINRL